MSLCSMEVGADGVAVVRLNNPPVNALHPKVLASLAKTMEEAQGRTDVRAIVVTGAGKSFSAGFDISQFDPEKGAGASSDEGIKVQDTNAMLNKLLEEGAKPTVAAIQGVALGGGCEIAAACNARVCTKDARIGLPELQLGIIPGFGGTQRLPRLVGLQTGLEMILTSKPLKGSKAADVGLADIAVDQASDLLPRARQLALEIAAGKAKWNRTLQLSEKLEEPEVAKMILGIARDQTAKRAPHVKHPLLCIDAIEHGVTHGGKAGLQAEARAFEEAASLPAHRALVHVFFAQRGTKKVKGVTDCKAPPRKIKTVAVLGGGLMGSGIATACLLAGMEVILKEINHKFLEGGKQRIASNLASSVKRRKLTQNQANKLLTERLVGTVDFTSDFARADMVVEAVIENVPLKQDIFAQLEKICSKECILASNTSTIDITVIAAKMQQPERIVGAHFFSPAHIMPLLEIVRSEQTPADIVRDTITWGTRIRKTPVVVGNCTGFAVNRVFFPYTQAATLLADAGVDPYRIDKVIQYGFGMPMGPFRLMDLVGGDISLHVGSNFVSSFPERAYMNPRGPIVQFNERKWLGEKTGKGWYNFVKQEQEGKKPRIKAVKQPEAIAEVMESSRRSAAELGVVPLAQVTDRDIAEMIFFPVVNEACRVLAESIVDKASDLDIATVMSMGFPPYRGGVVKWADNENGAALVAARLQQFARMFPSQAGFFVPCEYLLNCAARGVPLAHGQAFYENPLSKM